MGSTTSLSVEKNDSVISLIKLLPVCNENSPFFTMTLNNLKTKILKASLIIDEDLINDIKFIYALRWSELVDTPNDYLRSMDAPNKFWVSLAKKLAKLNLIPSNYYKLLIPTLNHDIDAITYDELITHSLSYYILSEQNNELILLTNCVNHHKQYGTFYNPNHHPSKPLTAKEQQRLCYAAPYFLSYYESIKIPHDLPIYKSTLNAVKRLVNKSIFQEGLLLGQKYTEAHQRSADEAYETFLAFRKKLPEEERANLDGQVIILDGQQHTFLDILEIICDKGECLAAYGLFFLKLVIDYQPNATFYHYDDLNKYRNCSAKKTYRSVSEEEAIRRIKILLVSLMTYRFDYLWGTGKSLELWDLANTTTQTGKELFDKLQLLIALETIESPEKIYHLLVDEIIEPALENETVVQKIIRRTSTTEWLQSILDDSMFRVDNQMTFEPEQLFIFFNSMLEVYPCLTEQIEFFLEDLLKTLLQENRNDSLQWVRVNIKFLEHLALYDADQQQEILNKLRNDSASVSPSLLLQCLDTFISTRLINDRQTIKKTTVTFFHEINEQKFFYNEMSSVWDSYNTNETITIRKIFAALDNNPEKRRMLSNQLSIYWDELKTPIPEKNTVHYLSLSSFLGVVR